jgi:hypothetical protein
MNKYIIYQGSGGLIHMLGGLAYCCEFVSKKRNHNLIIDIKNHIAFQNYFSKYFELNLIKYSEDYNDIDKELTHFYRIPLTEFNKRNAIYDNRKYIFEHNNIKLNLNKSLDKYKYNERILFYVGTGGNCKNYILKHIKVNSKIFEEIKKYKINEKYVAVHFRNTDRSNNINVFINQLKKYKCKIYLATDDSKALEKCKKALNNDNIISYSDPFDANGKNIHYNDPDKDKVIFRMLVDLYLMYNSNEFIPSLNSLVSRFVLFMRDNKKSIFI